jgi:hypothetical protein
MLILFLILPGLLVLGVGGAGARSVDGGIECVPERPSLMQAGTTGKDYTVPRKQVLLELFERPT